MTIKDMHYDFKLKFNKVDSQGNRNYLIPEIDWLLNEAAKLFVDLIAEPRRRNNLGFEINQRTIDDIRTIVVNSPFIAPSSDNIIALPDDYWYWAKGYARIRKGECPLRNARVIPRQHDDMFEESAFDKSSFKWKQVNALFNADGLFMSDAEGDFDIENVRITYIRKMAYMHNAEGFSAGGYRLPSGVLLTGSENCELPDHTHPEIVDIAVMLASGEVQASNYQQMLNKLKFTQII